MRFDQGTIVLAGYPGVGKTQTTENSAYKCLDLLESHFLWSSPNVDNPRFKADYIAALEEAFKSEDYDFIFISTNEDLIEAVPEYLSNSLYLVFPDIKLKSAFMNRFLALDYSEGYVEHAFNNWDKSIDDLQRNTNCAGYLKLETSDEYVDDVIEYIEKWRVFCAENS